MLNLCNSGTRLCDGLSRREFLRAGSLALTGLTLPALLSKQAHANTARPRAKSVIQLFMWGGPSQLETFDLKPNAPEGIRGDFQTIATRIPGTRISEHLPLLARSADRYAILRSVSHPGVNHGTSAYHMLTGHIHFTPGTLRHPTPNDFPSVGCTVARFMKRQPKDNLPPYVALPQVMHDGDGGEVPGQGPGLLGSRFAPFWVTGDPTRTDFSVDSLNLPDGVDGRRFRRRVGLQSALDQQAEAMARLPEARDMDGHYDRAFRLLQSDAARRAFHLASEPEKARDRYGWHHFGQSCLLARRLVEAGVPLVTVYWNLGGPPGQLGHWDTHADNFNTLKTVLLPPLDRALTALFDDLHERGLLDETLVLWMGEFGRTPRINRNAGRDHWGMCQSVLMAGAGVRGGQVYGRSDAWAAEPADAPVSPDDLAATVYDCLGVEIGEEVHDSQKRPLALRTGKPVAGLF
jgi:hypothetical protein